MSIFDAGDAGKNFFVVSLSNLTTVATASPETSIDMFGAICTLTEYTILVLRSHNI
jgi:hypothetical protein